MIFNKKIVYLLWFPIIFPGRNQKRAVLDIIKKISLQKQNIWIKIQDIDIDCRKIDSHYYLVMKSLTVSILFYNSFRSSNYKCTFNKLLTCIKMMFVTFLKQFNNRSFINISITLTYLDKKLCI